MNRHVHVMIAVLMIVMLAACGGGGESPAPTVTGVAAAGAPLGGAVTLKDSSTPPKELSIAADFRGSFSFNVSGLTAPFLLRSTGSTITGSNHTLYSLATTAGNCNINPLTHLAITMATGGQDPSGIFTNPTPAQIATISNALPEAVADIQNKLAPLFSRVRVSSSNIITERFTANGQGVDLLFDMVSITVTNGSVSIVNKADGGIIIPPTSIAGGALSASPDVNMMSPVFAITGHLSVATHVSARSKAPPYPNTPLIGPSTTDAQGNYKFFVPNGTYELTFLVVGFDASLVDVIVNNADVTGPSSGSN